MKRKKWREEEEQTLLNAYSSSMSSSSSSTSNSNSSKKLMMILPPVKRQKRYQPIADRVNSLHHLADPSSYPFLWSWRDIAIKIHNMRHQYLSVKQKILLFTNNSNNSSSNSQDQDRDALDWDRALDLWPNFLLYKEVFGDIALGPTAKNDHLSTTDDDQIDSDDLDGEDEEEEEEVKMDFDKKKKKKKGGRLRRSEKLRREERREQEDMEWMERVVGMQVEHEKQAMQMHADACQAQLQMLGILVRVVCQFLGPGSGGGDVGFPSQVVENLQQQQQQQQQRVVEEEETTESLVGHENGKNDGHSGNGYL